MTLESEKKVALRNSAIFPCGQESQRSVFNLNVCFTVSSGVPLSLPVIRFLLLLLLLLFFVCLLLFAGLLFLGFFFFVFLFCFFFVFFGGGCFFVCLFVCLFLLPGRTVGERDIGYPVSFLACSPQVQLCCVILYRAATVPFSPQVQTKHRCVDVGGPNISSS